MDHHKVLLALAANEKNGENFDENLEQILAKVVPQMPVKNQEELSEIKILNDVRTVRSTYLKTVLYVLKSLKNSHLSSSDTFFSVNQHKTVKNAVEIATNIGILPCLFKGIREGVYKMCPQAVRLVDEDLTDLQKYNRLSATVDYLMDCFQEITLRTALLPQIGVLLAGLLQLSYAPLMKPAASTDETSKQKSTSEFVMTQDLYKSLVNDQNKFRGLLASLMEKCPLSTVIKQLMVILGIKEAPNWIRRRTQALLVEALVRPNGVVSLIDAICGDNIDFGVHWAKLDTAARLIATSHGQDPEKYYSAVCSQLLNLLMSNNIKDSSTIANHCITALYEVNPEICVDKVIRKIIAPLKIESQNSENFVPVTEIHVENCIDNMTKCFISSDAKFKHPPCSLMSEVAVPLFCLYVKARGSVSLMQAKIKDLLINLLKDSTENLFTVFLQDDSNAGKFGIPISCAFGSNGGLEITGKMNQFDYELAADSLFVLVSDDNDLSYNLFNYLLKKFSKTELKGKKHVLENTEDTLNRIERQLTAMKLLSNLAGTREIQKAQRDKPEAMLSFIESLFNELSRKTADKQVENDEEDGNTEILYVSLMLIKVILSDSKKPKDWSRFIEFSAFLTDTIKRTKIPEQLRILVDEVVTVIKNRGRSTVRLYEDLSCDGKKETDFEKALKDLADPLLPVRAHGLMTLTKLLETRDPEALAKKDIILCFFQENLKDEDSFIYLSAVNGLCALASVFPQSVIEILVQEFIDMPERNTNGDISPEIRAKLGEILVKTTRSLGEICPAYKTILINGFLCGVRDPDDMVRASSLSCLGEICKVLGFRLGDATIEIIYCIGCIINTDKSLECRRAAVLVATLLIRGLGRDVLTDLGSDLVPFYRALKFLRDNDGDEVLRLHAQLALEELDDIVHGLLHKTPQFDKRIFMLPR